MIKRFTATGVRNFTWGNEPKSLIIDAEQIEDEYHSISELYQHRMALNAFLFKMMFKLDEQVRGSKAIREPLIMKSKLHNDGTRVEGGYFIVLANTNEGQISYHYKLEHWDKFNIPEVERIPFPYDGHTTNDCVKRLLRL